MIELVCLMRAKEVILVFLEQHDEQVGLSLADLKADSLLCLIECRANLVLPCKQDRVECLREEYGRLIQHKSVLLDADHMPSAISLEDPSNLLRVARCHKNQLQIRRILPHEVTQLLSADELTVAELVLEEEEMAFVDVIFQVDPHGILIDSDPMAANVQNFRFLANCLLEMYFGGYFALESNLSS